MSENGKENLAQWDEIIQRSETECASRGTSMRKRLFRLNFQEMTGISRQRVA